MALPSWVWVVGALGLLGVATRKKSAPTPPVLPVQHIESGEGYSRTEERAVFWGIWAEAAPAGKRYQWEWKPKFGAARTKASGFVFPSADEAKADLEATLRLLDAEEEQEAPPDWFPPPQNSRVYPPGADPRTVEPLDDPEGAVFSEDCAVLVIGPEWWDKIGDYVAAHPELDAQELFESVIEAEFPEDCEFAPGSGARMLRDELLERITDAQAGE